MSQVSPEIASWWPVAIFVLVLVSFFFHMRQGIASLKAQGRKFRPVPPADAIFSESRVSGNIEAGFLARISGASNALLVWVTPMEFAIEAVFPINVFFHEHALMQHVPLGKLRSIERAERGAVLVRFEDKEDNPLTLRLFLRRSEDLLSALAEMGAPANKSLERARER